MKKFIVNLWIASSPSQITVTAMNSANAQYIARKLYPMARIISARAIN